MQTVNRLAPYYQAKMRRLSPQQQKIINLLCDRTLGISVKEIAQRCFISQQTVSNQLKHLLKKGYVTKESKGRNSYYKAEDPLLQIYLTIATDRSPAA